VRGSCPSATRRTFCCPRGPTYPHVIHTLQYNGGAGLAPSRVRRPMIQTIATTYGVLLALTFIGMIWLSYKLDQ